MPDHDSMLGQNLVDVRNEARRNAQRGDQLFAVPPKLTERQEVALELTAGQGATDLDVGVELHARRGCGYCREHEPCDYAASTGREVLQALRKKGLVVRRRSGLWQHVGAQADVPSSQSDDFPEGF